MTQKNIVMLLGGTVVLAVLFYFTTSSGSFEGVQNKVALFDDVNGEAVGKFILEQGDRSVELAYKDNLWVVPERGGYPADREKISSLFLKLFDLSSSQLVRVSEAGLKKLALTEEGIKQGSTRVTLFTAEGKELGGIILGKKRKGTTPPAASQGNAFGGSPSAGSAGQYVKRTNRPEAYLVGLPIAVSVSLSNWLDTRVANELQSNIRAVTQVIVNGGDELITFEVVKGPEAATNAGSSPNKESISLNGDVPEGKEVQEASLWQVRSGLENLRINDVRSVDDETLKGLVFDRKTLFEVSNGLVYTVSSAERDEKVYGTIRVAFDEALGSELKQEFEKAKAEQEAAEKKARAETAKAVAEVEDSEKKETPEPKDQPTKPGSKALKKLVLADKAKADELSGKYQPWIFEFATHQGKKFRYTIDSLVKDKKKPAASSTISAAQPTAS